MVMANTWTKTTRDRPLNDGKIARGLAKFSGITDIPRSVFKRALYNAVCKPLQGHRMLISQRTPTEEAMAA